MARSPLRFSVRNERAERKIGAIGARLITNIRNDAKEVVREVLKDGVNAGKGPGAIALDLVGRTNASGRRVGGIIGMNAPQTQAALNLRERLESGDPAEMSKALGMKLRDNRFDATVQKAIDGEKELTSDQIDTMVDHYVSRAQKLRGETIARTEVNQAVQAANFESFEQALEQTNYSRESVTRVWRGSGNDNMRDTHEELDGQEVVGLDEPFVSSSGAEMMHPGDESMGAGADEIINCACDMEINVDFTEGVT